MEEATLVAMEEAFAAARKEAKTVAAATVAEDKYRKVIHEVQTQRSEDLKKSTEELSMAQKNYRNSQMVRKALICSLYF